METANPMIEINSTDQGRLLCERVASELGNRSDKACGPPLVSAMTNFLLDRVFQSIWGSPADKLTNWNKQSALSRVASIYGGKFPAIADAERPGQRMHEFLGRYRDRHRTFLLAEKAAVKRALSAGRDAPLHSAAQESRVAMETALYVCSYGCTPFMSAVRRVPPGLRPKAVEYVICPLAQENWELNRINMSLKQLETEAVNTLTSQLTSVKKDLSNSVVSEHSAILQVHAERSEVEQLDSKHELLIMRLKAEHCRQKELERSLKGQEGKLLSLGSKVSHAQVELARERELRDRDKKLHELHIAMEKQRLAAEAAHNRSLHEAMKAKDEIVKSKNVELMRQGMHLSRVHMLELARQHKLQEVAKSSLARVKRAAEMEIEPPRT